MREHLLIIGGTGMLKQATLHFAQSGQYKISLLARSEDRLNALVKQSDNINPIVADYGQKVAFIQSVKECILKRGHINKAIVWIHDYGKDTLFALTYLISEELKREKEVRVCIVYHLLGSAYYDPKKRNVTFGRQLSAFPNIDYRNILLGFVKEKNQSRWLSRDEISLGTIMALEKDLKHHIIGQTNPWDKRP